LSSLATCRVCGSSRSKHLCKTLNEHSETRWLDNLRCNHCGSVFIGNRLSHDELAEAYATLDEARYYEETAKTSAAKFRETARELAGLAPLSAEIIDIGTGNGNFARALLDRGFSSISIHEIPGAQIPGVPDAVQNIYRDFDHSSIPDHSFDVVTLMDVMEHVPDIDQTLRAVRRILRPGGLLYIHTPVVTPIDRLFQSIQGLRLIGGVGRAWQRARTSIFHLQVYARRALEPLMTRHGFEVVRLECRNELSWPLGRYVRVYLVDKRGLPRVLAPVVTGLLTPVLRSRLNNNKAVVAARLKV